MEMDKEWYQNRHFQNTCDKKVDGNTKYYSALLTVYYRIVYLKLLQMKPSVIQIANYTMLEL